MDYILMHIPSSGEWLILHWDDQQTDPDAICRCTCQACAGCTAGSKADWEPFEHCGSDRVRALDEIMMLNRQETKT